ncbi:MAG TPA: inositol monophosphatase family protein [Candidatus Limnocylindria bacterium]
MNDAEVARAAAAVGAAIVRDRFGGAHQRLDKGGLDFATDVDIDAERAIVDILRRERPADHIVGEEGGRQPGTAEGRTWLVDPLCGTANFAAGFRAVAVNVALVGRGGAGAAAVADPLTGEIFAADDDGACCYAGTGAVRLTPGGSSRLVDIDLDERPLPTRFKPLALLGDAEFRAAFQPRVTSTSLALTWVAAGRRAAYITDAALIENVHFAAGVAICLAARCAVSDLRGDPVSPGSAGAGLIAAADWTTHARLLAIIQRMAGGQG